MQQYGWKDWMAIPANRKLQEENPKQALMEFNIELNKRSRLASFVQSQHNSKR